MTVKVPLGGLDWPNWLSPQQTRAPLTLIPQVFAAPELIAVNFPLGGLLWPNVLSPQQATSPLILIAQVWKSPAAMSKK